MTGNVQFHKPEVPSYGYTFGPAMFNQNMAQAKAAGDTRFQAKQLDRAGMSRGRGQMQQAENQGAAAMAQGIAQAYGQQNQDDALLAGLSMDAETDQERQAQQFAAINTQRQNQYLGLLSGLFNG